MSDLGVVLGRLGALFGTSWGLGAILEALRAALGGRKPKHAIIPKSFKLLMLKKNLFTASLFKVTSGFTIKA